MAVTISSRSVVMTENNDEDTRFLKLKSIMFAGVNMTPGGRLTIKDSNGSIIGDHYVEAETENREFLSEKRCVRGVKLTEVPVGTWTVTLVYG